MTSRGNVLFILLYVSSEFFFFLSEWDSSLYTRAAAFRKVKLLFDSPLFFSRSNVVNETLQQTPYDDSTVRCSTNCSLNVRCCSYLKKKFFLASSECGEWTWNAKPPPGSVDVLFLPFPDWFCLINSTGWQHLKDPPRTKRSKTKPLPILVTPSCYYLNKFYNQV